MKIIKRESGVALITSLVFLAILMMITVASMRSTVLQEKMAFAVKDTGIALESADSAIVNAEAFLNSLCTRDDFDPSQISGLYDQGMAPMPASSAAGEAWVKVSDLVASYRQVTKLGAQTCLWDGSIPRPGVGVVEVGDAAKIQFPSYPGVAEEPRVYIEFVGPVAEDRGRRNPQQCGYECEPEASDLVGFRIYAQGTGATEFATRTLSSFYARRF